MVAKIDVVSRVGRIDKDIEALKAKLQAKMDERADLLNQAREQLAGLSTYTGRKRGPVKGTPNKLHRALTNKQVRDIRNAAAKGVSQNTLAAKYGLSQPTISNIIHRNTYADVK